MHLTSIPHDPKYQTMVISSFINKRRFTFVEYVAAVAVCLGLILFGLADFTVSPTFRSGSHM